MSPPSMLVGGWVWGMNEPDGSLTEAGGRDGAGRLVGHIRGIIKTDTHRDTHI